MSQFHSFKTAKPNPNAGEVSDIEPTELWENRDKVSIIDVRRPDEFTGELGHIPGAKMVVLDTLPDEIAQLPRDRSIVFVCRSGGRSARAAVWALSEGFESVYNMAGGMLLWNQLQLETSKK